MQKSRLQFIPLLLLTAGFASAQVVAPIEIRDSQLRVLQQGSMNELKLTAENISAHHFAFPFYFSRKLDVDEKQQRRIDQHSIRFERFDGATVVAISGNYYGAYSTAKFSEELRARQTFLDVVLPIMRAAVPAFKDDPVVQGYAVEVSHHVFGRTMGMPIERAENLMMYLPQKAAIKLVAAQNALGMQAALLEAEVFLNANPLSLWLSDSEQPATNEIAANEVTLPMVSHSSYPRSMSATDAVPENLTPEIPDGSKESPAIHDALAAADPRSAGGPVAMPPSATLNTVAPPARDTSAEALAALQSAIQEASNRMFNELKPLAQFVAYAPPTLIAFRHQVYLEVSINTALPDAAGASRYKQAALAFDDHISPLLRRVVSYFPGDQNFDGISFSTTVHAAIKPGPATKAASPLSVEFFFPLRALRCYESYDCTGQQLLNAGTVLINGERVGLELQSAESDRRP
jgi:hypothetical protein